MKELIGRLQEAINRLHGCDSRHVESIPVKEEFHGKTVWDGRVEIFSLAKHPDAWLCYAWAHQNDDGSERYVAVLGKYPVTSPIEAVRAALIAERRAAN